MPVARSYQSLEQVGEPYISNGKQYVNLRFKNGNVKPARWYSDSEYKKLYGELAVSGSTDPYHKPQKDVLGFVNGYITIFRKDGMNEENEYFKLGKMFRYCRWWGWYVCSNEALPEDLPADAEPVVLNWEIVGNPNGKLKPEAEVERAVGNLLYPPTEHEFNVSIGQRIELTLTVEKNIPLENNYGVSNLYRMLDANGNVYIWITGVKNWAVDTVHHIRGTIKDTKEYKGEPQIILKNCREVIK